MGWSAEKWMNVGGFNSHVLPFLQNILPEDFFCLHVIILWIC